MHQVKLRSVDLNLLVVLDLLLEHRSVTGAARAANMSQPATSRALGRLRALLGDPVLVRGRDGLVPTPRATALRPALRRALADLAGLMTPPRFDPASWRGPVTLAATDHQAATLLPPLVARLARRAPTLDLRVVPMWSATLDEIRDGRVDLTFAVTEQPLPPALCAAPLHDDTFVSLLRWDHPARRSWSLETFCALDHVLVTVLDEGPSALGTELARRGAARRVALRLPHFHAAMSVVAETDLVVSLPASIAYRFAAGLGLVVLPTPVERAPFTIAMVWSAALDADPAHAWLRVAVAEAGRDVGSAASKRAASELAG